MRALSVRRVTLLACLASLGGCAVAARADGDLDKVKHVVVLMQENHSFDNYFGVLPYVRGGPYHAGPCNEHDHRCVDGLTCKRHGSTLACENWNLDADAQGRERKVFSFHSANYCPGPDLNHEWAGSHQEANFDHPTETLRDSPNDGFVRVNDATLQPDRGPEGPTEDDTMGFYDQTDLPFYYSLAQTFAIGDRYFSSRGSSAPSAGSTRRRCARTSRRPDRTRAPVRTSTSSAFAYRSSPSPPSRSATTSPTWSPTTPRCSPSWRSASSGTRRARSHI